MYIRGALKIGLVAPVKPFHPYSVDDLAPLLDLHYLRIPPWLWFRFHGKLLSTQAAVNADGEYQWPHHEGNLPPPARSDLPTMNRLGMQETTLQRTPHKRYASPRNAATGTRFPSTWRSEFSTTPVLPLRAILNPTYTQFLSCESSKVASRSHSSWPTPPILINKSAVAWVSLIRVFAALLYRLGLSFSSVLLNNSIG